MTFHDTLNEYMDTLGISSRELSEVSGLSTSTLSRFRRGERAPSAGSESFKAVAEALILLSDKKGKPLSREQVYQRLSAELGASEKDKENFRHNLNSLISVLSINVASLAKDINYDASLISRIRTGKRQPTDLLKLGSKIASYTAAKYSDHASLSTVAGLLQVEASALSGSDYREAVLKWLISNENTSTDSSLKFIKALNDFNLDQYIKAIHFDSFKVPSAPFQIPGTRTYTGLEGFKQAELVWLKTTVLSKSRDSVIMYSDMPMEEMAKDLEFSKKWMFGMALMLKKGLHIHQIHNLDRSFGDMMLGLESWIPLYMTGQISPYYFKSINNSVFMSFFRVSGKAACSGEAIAGHHREGRYTVVKGSEDVNYFRRRGEAMLSKASPLMDIFTEDNSPSLSLFLEHEAQAVGQRRSQLSSLPLYTISEGLLDQILRTNRVDAETAEKVKKRRAKQASLIMSILSHSTVCDGIPLLSREEFEKQGMSLSLSQIFLPFDIPYTFDQYLIHLSETKAFAKKHQNYSVSENTNPPFGNIQISVFQKKWVMISKNKAPTIHFVIRHPKLRESIENLTVPITE